VKYTVSMGIAEIDNSIESYEAWIEFSDLAMYRAKDAGRNQIALHTNPVA
jgi:diguanylate cyclase